MSEAEKIISYIQRRANEYHALGLDFRAQGNKTMTERRIGQFITLMALLEDLEDGEHLREPS